MSRITTGLLADNKEPKMAKMSMKKWEGSKEDLAQDKKLAKKHNMSFNEWENSAGDVQHDKQQNMSGLRGGGIAMRGKGIALKKGGKVMMKARGGQVRDGMDEDSGTLRMETMPSGAKQYVRGSERDDKAKKILGYQQNEVDQMKPGSSDFKDHDKIFNALSKAQHENMDVYEKETEPKKMRGGGIAMKGKGIALKKGGPIKEAKTGEVYASKAAMKKHEAMESPAMERSEERMRGGGIAMKGKGVALRGGGIATRGMGIALKGGGRAKGCM